MYGLYKKNRLNFSLVWIIAYVVLLIFGFIKRHDLSEEYGLCSFTGNLKSFLYFIPLLLIITTNLWNGVTITVSVTEAALHILSMLCVGFIEEVVFRGFLFKAMCKDNVKLAIFVSSLTFGIGHIVNLLNGADFVPTLLQVCYASAIGFLFTIIFYKGKSLLPCIIAHGIFNSLSIFATQGSQTFKLITALVLCAISVGYALWILKKTEKLEGVGKEK